jgi:3-keto-5-aminohexanoate cleavage enzyme
VGKQKVIITVHINGPTRDTTPHVACSPQEIAEQAVECWRQGASVVHYHATDPVTGTQSSDVALYAETVKLIRRECDLITFPTLGAHIVQSEGRVAHIVEMAKDPETKPDCIPIDMLTTNVDSYDRDKKAFATLDRVYSNTTGALIDISERVRAVGVRPVPMIWNVPGVRLTQAFVEMGVVSEPLFCEVSVFGEPHLGFGHPATIKGLEAVIDFFPPGADWRWTVSVIGANAFAVLAAAIERGGDAAIGLHDYPYPELGFPTNAELVARVADMAKSMGREIATTAETRDMLDMK